MTDEKHAQEWAGRICVRLSLDAHDDEEIMASELLPLIQAARAEALEEAAAWCDTVCLSAGEEVAGILAQQIRALAALPAGEPQTQKARPTEAEARLTSSQIG